MSLVRPVLHRTALALGAALLAGVLLWVGAPAASAHAVLVAASPPAGADLDAPPSFVELTFNEPVEVPTGGLRVFDAGAGRVDTGPQDTADPSLVRVGLPDDLPDGGYVVTYRVVSDDGHPIAGTLTFTVGGAAPVDEAVVAELFGGAGPDLTGVLGPVLRGLGYLAALLAAGAVVFATLIARREPERADARYVGGYAALAGIALTLLAVPVQAAALGGTGILEAATSPSMLREALASGFGEGSVLRVVGLAVLAAAWVRPGPGLLVGLAAGATLGSFLRDGHQRTIEPTWLLVSGDAVHLAAGAVWLAGLVLLVRMLRTAEVDDPLEAARLVVRFSSVALVSVVVLLVSGTAMAWVLVGTPRALTTTSYGWTLVGKLGAVAAVVVIAVYNRRSLVPAVAGALAPRGGSEPSTDQLEDRTVPASRRVGWRRLRITMGAEAAILVLVLLVTGFLVSQQPASEQAGLRGFHQVTAPLGDDLEVDVVVEPNRAGRNVVHAYVLDATGRPSAEADDLRFELTYVPEGIGPITIEPFFAGPGHWIATVDDLVFPGEWEIRVVVGLGRFGEESAEVVVPVAR